MPVLSAKDLDFTVGKNEVLITTTASTINSTMVNTKKVFLIRKFILKIFILNLLLTTKFFFKVKALAEGSVGTVKSMRDLMSTVENFVDAIRSGWSYYIFRGNSILFQK